MHVTGQVGKYSRRERVPSEPEVKILEALLEIGDAWSYGYLLNKKYGISLPTAYKWIDTFSERGYLDKAAVVVSGRRRRVVKLNERGMDFAKRRLEDAEFEKEYKRSEVVTSDST